MLENIKLSKSSCKWKKLWIGQGREFYNSFMQKWLDDNDAVMYWTYNEVKSIAAESIRTLTGKMYKKMAASDSKSYLSYLNKLLDQCNNTYHRSIDKNLLMLIILLWLANLNRLTKRWQNIQDY